MNFSWITIFYTTLLANSVFAIVGSPSNPQSFPVGQEGPNGPTDISLLSHASVRPDSRPLNLGGQSAEMIVTPELKNEINKYSSKIKEDITNTVLYQNPGIIPEEYVSNFRFAMSYLRLVPLTYTTQPVAGTIYHVKTAFGYQCFDVYLFQDLPSAPSGQEIFYKRVLGPIPCSVE